MIDSWRYSKSTYLAAFFTLVGGLLIFGLALHSHRYSEVLGGVIGGITIIFGMITAEWLRSSREIVETTQNRYEELLNVFEPLLFNFELFSKSPFSESQKTNLKNFVSSGSLIRKLSRSTRWPQPNARQIRQEFWEFGIKWGALIGDAFENDYVWSVEDRWELVDELEKYGPMIWGVKEAEALSRRSKMSHIRRTPQSERLPAWWTRGLEE